MQDFIRQSAVAGRVILHEEVARDGAQGKTLLTGLQRVAVANLHCKVFGAAARDHVVFMAGFPSAGNEEFRAVRQVVHEVDSCFIGVAGRLIRADLDALASAIDGAKYGRIVLVVPVSEATCSALMHKSESECLAIAVDAVSYVRDQVDCAAVDVALVDATRTDPSFVSDAASTLTAAGASMAIVCDTVGALYPRGAKAFFDKIRSGKSEEVQFIAHMHNDLGFGLANTLEALASGHRGLTSSWLGVGERAGMPATEQLLFSLTHEASRRSQNLGVFDELRLPEIDLKAIYPTAKFIAETLNYPIRSTDPIVGSGVNSISTGTPYANPLIFSPFDAEEVLGIPRRFHLTALVNSGIASDVAMRLGFRLEKEALGRAVAWVKSEAHRRGVAIISDEDFSEWLTAEYPSASSVAATI